MELRNKALPICGSEQEELENNKAVTSSKLPTGVYNLSGDYYINKYLQGFLSANTKRIYGKSIEEFFRWKTGKFHSVTIRELITNADQAEDYKLKLIKMLNDKEIKSATYNAKIKGIRKFFDWLIPETYDNHKRAGLMDINPFKNVKLLDEKYDAEGSDYLTEEELLLMLNNPYGEDAHIQKRNLLILILAITTGIRKDSLMSLQLENIEKIDGNWCISTVDKRKQVKKGIREEYYDMLMDWYDADLKLRSDKNNSIFNIRPKTGGDMIRKWANYVGITDKKITFHSLRTTCAIELYKLTNNIYEVQKFMVHSEISTTQIYTGKDKQVLNGAMNLINGLKNHTTFDEQIMEMNEEQKTQLLLGLNAQIKAQLLIEIQK